MASYTSFSSRSRFRDGRLGTLDLNAAAGSRREHPTLPYAPPLPHDSTTQSDNMHKPEVSLARPREKRI